MGCVEEYGVIDQIDFIVGAFGKALVSVGGYCICHPILRDYLINKTRPLIFSTALPPINIAWSCFILDQVPLMSQRRKHLMKLSDDLSKVVRLAKLPYPSVSQIIPVILSDNARTLNAAADLGRQGYHVLAVRPLTVPKGQSRLRICLNSAINDDKMATFTQVLSQLIKSEGK